MAETHLARVWDIIERVGVCMLTTRFTDGLRARPLQPRPDRRAGILWFVTDAASAKLDEIEAVHEVGLTFVDSGANAYLSLTAQAEIRRDPKQAAAIWTATDTMWWSGPEDPQVRVIRVTPLTAELWDGPASKAVAALAFVKSRLTGEEPDLGENRKLTVPM